MSQCLRGEMIFFPAPPRLCASAVKIVFCPKRKRPHSSLNVAFLILIRQRPTLPHSFPCSTIGPARLNFRVRDGNGCDPRGKITGKFGVLQIPHHFCSLGIRDPSGFALRISAASSRSPLRLPHPC